MALICDIGRLVGPDRKCCGDMIDKLETCRIDLSSVNSKLSNLTNQLDSCNSLTSELENLNKNLNLELSDMYLEITTLENEKLTLIDKIKYLEDSIKPSAEEEESNNKYPKVKVFYNGRIWGRSTQRIPIDVRLFYTPNDYSLLNFIETNNLKIKNIEFDVPRVYKYIMENFYKYTYDDKNYGVPEYWEFFFEMISNISSGYDCDSWANFIANVLVAGGVPAWKVRIVVGNCRYGGHATVYVRSDVDKRFHHINSTNSNFYFKNLSEYPTSDDAKPGLNNATPKDPMGISEVMFSYSKDFAWGSGSFKASKKSKLNFIIKPW